MSGAWNSRPSLAATWPAFMSMPIAVPSSSGSATARQTSARTRVSAPPTGVPSGDGVPPRRRTVRRDRQDAMPVSASRRRRGQCCRSGPGRAGSRASARPMPGGRSPEGFFQALQGAALDGDRHGRHLRDFPAAHRQAPEPVLPGQGNTCRTPGVRPLLQGGVVQLPLALRHPLQAVPVVPRLRQQTVRHLAVCMLRFRPGRHAASPEQDGKETGYRMEHAGRQAPAGLQFRPCRRHDAVRLSLGVPISPGGLCSAPPWFTSVPREGRLAPLLTLSGLPRRLC